MPDTTALLARIERLETQLARREAVDAIQKLMGAYTVNFSPKYMSRALDFYALDRPDVSVEIGDRGVYMGEAALRKLFSAQFTMSLAGNLLIHYLATPMIEVAADGESARGVWRSPGIEAVVPAGGGRPVPLWSFGAYAVDFIRQGADWKILHLHWFRTIKCSYEQAWVDDLSMTHTGRLPGGTAVQATTYHNPYTPESVQEPVPPCPPPYESMTTPDWMVKEQLTQ
jgi:SnoaL-like domain